MNPFVFWAALVTAFFMSLFLSAAAPHNVAQVAGAALGWIATIGLGWTRWVRRPAPWLGQLAALAGAVILVALVHDWLPRTDVFVVYRKNCPPRTGSFWPLFFVWALGCGLQAFALWGRRFRMAQARAATLRSVLWWLCILAWTAVCGYVFVRNINADAFAVSVKAFAKVAGGLLAMAGVFALPIWLLTRSEKKVRRQVLADYGKIDRATRLAVLQMIDRHARTGEFRLLYRDANEAGTADPIAHVGGQPLVAPGEEWPRDEEGKPGTFLLQLPLHGVAHEAWNDRLVAVYLLQYELMARSHAAASVLVAKTPAETGIEVVPQALQPLALPLAPRTDDHDEEGEPDAVDADWLLEQVPGLAAALSRFTTRPGRVLSMLLAGEGDGHAFRSEEAILVGGRPELIQGEHDPVCALCRQPMRFLCQFGDVTASFELGDCGVGYVYGCDAHPEHCQAFADCF